MPEESVVYAISDTHLGLRERTRNGHSDEPTILAGFLRWLNGLRRQHEEIPVWEHGSFSQRTLCPPSHLLLLGDIIELWDAENQSVLLSSTPIADILNSLEAEKIYVLGNHDNILETLVGLYPFGHPPLKVVADVYPEADQYSGMICPMRIGSRSFLFLHGHQLDRPFRLVGDAWRVLGFLRQFGAAIGGYAWAVFVVWLLTFVVQLLAAAPLWSWLVTSALALLWIPRLSMKIARPIWRKLVGRRYDREGALHGFQSWWRTLRHRVAGTEDLGVVYGHTHLLDWLEVGPGVEYEPGLTAAEDAVAATLRTSGKRQALFNLSSWISTPKRYEKVVWATIFYADDEGPLLLGWDWRADPPRPFHIPKEFVRRRRLGLLLGPHDEAIATNLRWPGKLIEKWKTGVEPV